MSPIITRIVNLSLTTGEFSPQLKHSIITSVLKKLSLSMYGNGFLSRADRCEILHGGSATSRTRFLPFWGIAQGWPNLGRQHERGSIFWALQ